MKLPASLFALSLLAACNVNTRDAENKSKGNEFTTKDAALTAVIQTLPQVLSSSQKRLYNLTDADLKAVTPGKEVAVWEITFDEIMKAPEGDLATLLTRDSSSALVPLAVNNATRLFVEMKNEGNTWRIQSVGNRKFLNALKDPPAAQNSEVVSIHGLAIDLVKRTDASGVVYVPTETNKQAGFVKDTPYTGAVALQNLKAYASVLSRQFGDKLKTGEIDE